MNKNELRQWAKDKRAQIPKNQRVRDEIHLKHNINTIISAHAAKGCVGIYYPIGTEISPLGLQLNNLCLPVIRDDKTLAFYEWKDGERLVKRDFDIPIPDTRHKNPVIPDVIFAPLLLCDDQGNRLGYGKGHYDRYLSALNPKPLLCGVCFEEQIYPNSLPAEPHDVTLDFILTPKRIIQIA